MTHCACVFQLLESIHPFPQNVWFQKRVPAHSYDEGAAAAAGEGGEEEEEEEGFVVPDGYLSEEERGVSDDAALDEDAAEGADPAGMANNGLIP